ncbi:MAG: UDP-N-acetylmuramoyl-L-alanine--D-glutamate ligase [Elusimicrobiota bacterium]
MNKKIAVLGLSRSGLACANLLAKQKAEVLISEVRPKKAVWEYWSKLNKNITAEFGGHSEKILAAELIVLSPGVHSNLKILQEAKKRNIPIVSELEIAWQSVHPQRTIAVTGTNGKTTTVTLLGEIFRQAGKDTVVAGNIGLALSDCVDRIKRKTFLVLEVSSYQLENCVSFSPQIAVILNLTPDHLEHHKTLAHYWRAKKKIFANQTKSDFLVLNYDDRRCRQLTGKTKSKIIFFSRRELLAEGVFLRDKNIVVRSGGKEVVLFPYEKLLIPGAHNLENVLASCAVGVAAKISLKALRAALPVFSGVEHRIEKVATIAGVDYINDSKGTNVDSTLCALKSFPGKIILIMGGQDKGSPYTPLIPQIKKKVKTLLLIGEAGGKIARELKGITMIFLLDNLNQALKKAVALANPRDTVLFSPACASFDQYENFEHRGRHFKELVLRGRS